MPRIHIIRDLCNPCHRDGHDTEGKLFVLREGTRKSDKAKVIILCDVHEKEILGPLRTELADGEVWTEDDPPVKPGAVAVGTPTAPSAPSAPRTSKGRAVTPAKGAPEGFMAPPIAEADLPPDLPAPVTEGDLQTWSCDEKECAGKPEASWTNRDRARPNHSLRMHLRNQHGRDV